MKKDKIDEKKRFRRLKRNIIRPAFLVLLKYFEIFSFYFLRSSSQRALLQSIIMKNLLQFYNVEYIIHLYSVLYCKVHYTYKVPVQTVAK